MTVVLIMGQRVNFNTQSKHRSCVDQAHSDTPLSHYDPHSRTGFAYRRGASPVRKAKKTSDPDRVEVVAWIVGILEKNFVMKRCDPLIDDVERIRTDE